ncbi:MAG TPA: SH3 domain-containing protein [Gemmatimonas sp.]|uniref:SH3 domain-containing protein n=1 Tax=Gemmatimonas sp. TaxID=1962908 RepID=UPI002ED78C16
MQTRHGFTLLTLQEFEQWIVQQRVGRTVLTLQQHHTWSPGYRQFNGSNHFDLQLGMKRHHVTNNGWADIGQHFTSFPDGTIMTGRSLEQVPACIKGQNAHAICIEHIGNFDTGGDTMSAAHRATIVGMTASICRRFAIPVNSDRVVYHHWFDLDTGARTNGAGTTKTCPGTAFFGGNKVGHAEQGFLPLVRQTLGGVVSAPLPTTVRYGVVKADTLNVRSAPAANAARRNVVLAGAILRIHDERDGWFRLSAANDEWVSARYVQLVERATVNSDVLNVRNGPGTQFDKLAALSRAQEVFVHERRDGWCRIGQESRWVSLSYLTFA